MKDKNINHVMKWKFQWWENFGFFIPKDRWLYWWDFFVNKKNFWKAKNWDTVDAIELDNSKWKKPEAQIIKIYWTENKIIQKYIEWIYSWWDWNFGFIDVEWQEKWYFVYWNKKKWAKDWDKVKAEIITFKWKKEAIVIEILQNKSEIIIWKYLDKDNFWFVIAEKNIWKKWTTWDIFIAWSRKNWAKNWDTVEVEIIKKWKKNLEWIITKIL